MIRTPSVSVLRDSDFCIDYTLFFFFFFVISINIPLSWVFFQVVGHYTQDVPRQTTQSPRTTPTSNIVIESKITIGEALEATALAAGDKPVDQGDVAAIQAAEVRATRRNVITPGGVGAMAQSAATMNARIDRDEVKTKLADVLTDASALLPDDKPVTRQDEEGIIGAELRNSPNLATHPGGVAASVVAAARINERDDK
ncbi:hypothetical protein IFM89_023808 [Coptis chinensis]|uniref:SMP domain-containing protein n=1 Tax=Coptis chinensis TaxID=261450 RepID=A0A835HUG5_9MAGN|nr:hypothetical protein IFM89_023808 [Coptis chinensis]